MIAAGKECEFSFEAMFAAENVCDFYSGALYWVL
jgi:hypothetical protein